MAFDLVAAIRGIHIVTAALWVGGAFFMAFILGPSLKAAGPGAGPVMMTAMRRGGFGPFFGSVATIAIMSGGYVYGNLGYGSLAFTSPSNIFLTFGVVLALVAWLEGILVILPTEARLKRLVRSMPADAPPSPEAAAEFQALGAKQAKASAVAGVLLVVTLLTMTFYKAF